MKLSAVAVLSVVATLFFVSFASLLLSGCAATLECGSWVFNGTTQSNPDSFPLSSGFTFNPSACGKNCECEIDAMIQMTWVYDFDEHTNLYADSGDEARATPNGWNIDQLDGWAYGWYALLNDGTTFDPGYNTTGGNGTANTLYDDPGGWPNHTWFYAVDAAVCFKSKTCSNRILGYYFWSWTIDASGNANKFIIAPAWKDLDAEFQSAVAGWNSWAPTSGTQNLGSAYPGQPVLPNAIKLPTMTDL
jgi:hypothetical protein